jgi:hypothetical protein
MRPDGAGALHLRITAMNEWVRKQNLLPLTAAYVKKFLSQSHFYSVISFIKRRQPANLSIMKST